MNWELVISSALVSLTMAQMSHLGKFSWYESFFQLSLGIFFWEGRGRAHRMHHPSSLIRTKPIPPQEKYGALTTGPPGKSLSGILGWSLVKDFLWAVKTPGLAHFLLRALQTKGRDRSIQNCPLFLFILMPCDCPLDFKSDKCGLHSEHTSNLYWLWKCCTQYASKFGKLSSGHRTGKGPFSFQSQRKAMPKNAQTTAQLHSSHVLVK